MEHETDSTTEEKVSVIVPLYNEVDSVRTLYGELHRVLTDWKHAYEIILVDDGSQDGTGAIIDELAARDANVMAVHLRRNFGQTAAIAAGIDHSSGPIVVTLDGDLQNDPADIPALVERLNAGYDVVSGWRKARQDQGLTRVVPSRCANWLIRRVSGVDLHDIGCTLKAYRREVLSGLRLYGEMHRFLPIHACLRGGSITEMVVNHRARRFGRSKYGMGRIYKVILDLLLLKFMASYCVRPIHVFGGVGLLCLIGSLVPAGLAVAFKFAWVERWQKDFVETPLPVVAAVMVLVGVLSIQQGLLAELLTRTYFESQNKRTYVVGRVSRPRSSVHL
jgi:glycosyltransferase involved in cell wall biosynthesis